MERQGHRSGECEQHAGDAHVVHVARRDGQSARRQAERGREHRDGDRDIDQKP